MNFIQQLKANRIGPDILATHWLLYFNFGQKLLKKKLLKCGKNVCLRPGCILVDMDSIEIGDNVIIRPGTELYANTARGAKIIIEDNVLIGSNVMITVNNHNYEKIDTLIKDQGGSAGTIIVKEGAWIGARAIVLSKTGIIGRNSVIGAGSVVTKEINDYCVAAGVPAKIIKNLNKS